MATQTITLSVPEAPKQRLSIPDHLLSGLDPEWVELWENHGSRMTRADELTIEEFRKDPSAYSFTYHLFAGDCAESSHSEITEEEFAIDEELVTGPDTFRVEDLRIPVSCPRGEITIRVYTPKGAGPFPVHLNFHGGKVPSYQIRSFN